MNNLKEKVLAFIEDEVYAVVSSSNRAGQPESALVGFSHTDNFEIVLATNQNTRKVQNILLNPNVSLVIGLGGEKYTSVQLEGIARVLPADQASEYAQDHYKKIPSAKKHMNVEGECFVVVIPSWARYTNYSVSPEEILEDYLDVD